MVFLISHSNTNKYLASTPQNQNRKHSCGRISNEKSEYPMKRTMDGTSRLLYLDVCEKRRKKSKYQKKVSKMIQQCYDDKTTKEYCHGRSMDETEQNKIQLNHPRRTQYKSYVQGVVGRNIPGEVCLHLQKMRTFAKKL